MIITIITIWVGFILPAGYLWYVCRENFPETTRWSVITVLHGFWAAIVLFALLFLILRSL